jgi:hypothetical protein
MNKFEASDNHSLINRCPRKYESIVSRDAWQMIIVKIETHPSIYETNRTNRRPLTQPSDESGSALRGEEKNDGVSIPKARHSLSLKYHDPFAKLSELGRGERL